MNHTSRNDFRFVRCSVRAKHVNLVSQRCCRRSRGKCYMLETVSVQVLSSATSNNFHRHGTSHPELGSSHAKYHAMVPTTTLVSPLTSSGQPRRRAGQYTGAALQDARRSKERTYPELLRSRRCRLVVFALEIGGRWSPEATSFLRMLAHTKARAAPNILRRAVEASLLSRWSAILTHAA